MIPQATAVHYWEQQRLTLATLTATRRMWRRMTPDFDTSWATVLRLLVVLVTGAQLGATRSAVAYIPAVLLETGQDDDPVGEVQPRAFAGIASDGRPLDSLLYGAVTEAKTAVERERPPGEALAEGGRWLDMAVQTQIADAGRAATQVAIVARPSVDGWVRMLNLPSCSRCAILAGRFYRWSEGFERHPRCDCRHIPASEALADDLTTDPDAAVRSGQVTGLSETDRKAFAEGADLGQLVNARRGKSGLRSMTTTEGTTRRGTAGKRLQGKQRLTPDGIYRVASSRGEAIDLLRRHGYII